MDFKFKDEFTMEISCKRRVYSGSSTQVFAWESDLKIACVVMVPKPEKIEDDDDDDDDAGKSNPFPNSNKTLDADFITTSQRAL